jgi:hypothetical protein
MAATELQLRMYLQLLELLDERHLQLQLRVLHGRRMI